MEKLTYAQVGVGVAFMMLAAQFAVLVITAVNSFRAQKRHVSFETVFATREEVERVAEELGALKKEIVTNGDARKAAIEGKVEEAHKEAREAASDLAESLGEVKTDVAGLRSDTVHLNQSVTLLTAAIQRGK